jgi:signal transduction histidine kinase
MRFGRWCRDGLTGFAAGSWIAAWSAGLVLGLGAEWLARSGQSLAAAVADLVVGWTLIACGLIATARRVQGRVGILLTLAGFAWFLGTHSGSRFGPVATVGTALVFLHRGPLLHAIIGYPSGRPSDRLSLAVAVACYVYAAAVPLARNDVVTIVVAVAVLAVTVRGWTLAAGPERRARMTAVFAAVALAASLAAGSLRRLVGTGPDPGHEAVLWSYEVVLVLIALGFVVDLLRGPQGHAAVTKLVVDLGGDAEAGTLRPRLAHALGDRSLVIAYWLPELSGYVDERGKPVDLPEAGSGRAVTVVEQDGEPYAVLVHDVAVLNAPGLVNSVAGAARIALSNVRLRADVQRQVAELDASRRRILEASDAQRRRFQQQLQASAGQHLGTAEELLDLAAREAAVCPDRSAADALAAIRGELEETRAELRELAAGIHPASLTERGLGAALASLADRSPVLVRLAAPVARLPAAIETAIYFVCSEALANVAKHARATHVDIEVRMATDLVTVVVADDGTGGANPSAGSGLKGIADRVEALGGRLIVQSPAAGGTRLQAEIPTPPVVREPEAPA